MSLVRGAWSDADPADACEMKHKPDGRRQVRRCGAVALVLALALVVTSAWAAPSTNEYVTGSGPSGVTRGPDGNVWFVEATANRVGRVTPAGTVTAFSAGIDVALRPDEYHGGSRRQSLVHGVQPRSHRAHHAGRRRDRMGRPGRRSRAARHHGRPGRQPLVHPVRERPDRGHLANRRDPNAFSITGSGDSPYGIAAGPDGNLWFTENGSSEIGRMTTSGVLTEFTLPSGSQPTGITRGPDGNMWFTLNANPGSIGRITPAGVDHLLLRGPDRELRAARHRRR